VNLEHPSRWSARDPDGFYGWWMVGLAGLTLALSGPGQSIVVAVFREPMGAGLGISDSAMAAAYLVGTVTASSLLPSVGRWIDRVGVRRAATVIVIVFALVLVHMSLVRGVVWLAVGFVGIRLLGQGSMSLVSSVAVIHWFDRRRGRALGIQTTIGLCGMASVAVVLALAVDRWGWRTGWLAAACGVVVLALPIARFGFIDGPEQLGQQADGSSWNASAPAPSGGRAPGFHGSIVRSTAFWVLGSVTGLNSMLVTGLVFHQINLLGEVGFSEARAAAVFLPQAAGAVVGGLVFGWLSDRAVWSLLPAVTMILLGVTVLLGGAVASDPEVLVYAVVLGACTGSTHTVTSAMLPRLFGVARVGAIAGALGFVGVVGSSLGPLVFALGEGMFGGYRATSTASVVLPVAGVVTALVLRPALVRTAG